MMTFSHKYYKNGVLTILFYILASLAVYLLNKVSPSGPCTPGMGALLGILMIGVSIALLVWNLIQVIFKDKGYLYSVIVHGIAWSVFLLQ
jgi:hypothetical protein